MDGNRENRTAESVAARASELPTPLGADEAFCDQCERYGELTMPRLDDLIHDAALLVDGASLGLRLPAIEWEAGVLEALRELKARRDDQR